MTRVIKMSDVYGAARDFGGYGLSYDNWDRMSLPEIEEAIEGAGASPADDGSVNRVATAENVIITQPVVQTPRRRLQAGVSITIGGVNGRHTKLPAAKETSQATTETQPKSSKVKPRRVTARA